MATNPSTLPENSGRITAPDANYPYGSAKNDSTGTAGDGTPIRAPWMNDWYGFMQALLTRAAIVPSGNAETALNSQLLDAIDAIIAEQAAGGGGVAGAASNLKVSATGLNATVSVTADEIVAEDASNQYQTLRAVSVSPRLAASGADGLDTGTSAINTWYSVWVIWDGTTIAGLLSASATSPVLPSGYTHKARVGWVRSDSNGANKYPLSFIQLGEIAQYVVAAGSNVPARPIAASGVAGNPATPAYVAVSIGSFVPPTAKSIQGTVSQPVITTNAGAIVAPNNSYGGNASTVNPPTASAWSGSSGTAHIPFEMVLESANIFWASNFSGNLITISGWKDNL